MKLRFFQTYNEYGANSEITLQYWDEDCKRWINVPFVRVSEEYEEEALTHKGI